MRRRKVGIAVVLLLLIVGACTFGATMAYRAAIRHPWAYDTFGITPQGNLRERAVAERFFKEAMESGLVRKVEKQVVWVDPLAWARTNRDQKERLITCSAAAMSGLGGYMTVTIRSYADDQTLGGLSLLRGTYITP